MDRSTTLGLMAALLAIAVFAGWRGARPPNPHRGPRLIPWRPLMVISTLGVLLLLIHLMHGEGG